MTHHSGSIRALDYNEDGSILYTAGADHSFSVVTMQRMEGQLAGAHEEAINAVAHIEDSHIIATGDDDGVIKIWDLRQAHSGKKSCIITFNEHEGSISGFEYVKEHKMLLASANDGCLGVFDLRKPALYAMSDSFGEDQNAVLLMKHGKKVVTASSEGVLNLFSWDWFGDCNDRIIGHPNSVTCMAKLDEDTIITGAEDGLLRVVSVLPNRILSIVGDALDQEEGYHIQAVTLNHDRTLVASCSPDDIIKVMDVSYFKDRPKDGSFNLDAYEASLEHKPNHLKPEKVIPEGEEWQDCEEDSDMSDSDSDEDMSDSSDDESMDTNQHKKRNKTLNNKKATVGLSKKMVQQQKAKDFFKDM